MTELRVKHTEFTPNQPEDRIWGREVHETSTPSTPHPLKVLFFEAFRQATPNLQAVDGQEHFGTPCLGSPRSSQPSIFHPKIWEIHAAINEIPVEDIPELSKMEPGRSW